MKTILITLLLVVAVSARWIPIWNRPYENGQYSRDGAIVELLPNFTSYWDEHARNRQECSGMLDVATATSQVLNMSLSRTTSWPTRTNGIIQKFFFLADFGVVMITNASPTYEFYWKNNHLGSWVNMGVVGSLKLRSKPLSLLPVYNSNDKTMAFFVGMEGGHIATVSPTNPSGIQYLDFSTQGSVGSITQIRVANSLRKGKEMLFFSSTGHVFSLDGALNKKTLRFTTVSSSSIEDVLIWRIGKGYLAIILYKDGKITAFNEEEVEKTFPEAESLPATCKMILASDFDSSDLLVLGGCNGHVRTVNLTAFAESDYQEVKFNVILQDTTTIDAPRIYQMSFNYLQTTEPNTKTLLQKGQPVLVLAKTARLIYMYNFATQEKNTLFTYWGPENATITTPIRFVPLNTVTGVPRQNCENPNYGTTAFVEVGLSNGRLWELQNIPFLHSTPSAANVHVVKRRVFNNQPGFELQPFDQEKEGISWVAIARSLIKFYQPGVSTPKICDLLNSCCQVYDESSEILHPNCQLNGSTVSSYLMSTLDQYGISTTRSKDIPSFMRVQAEVTNNNVIVIRKKDNQFAVITGYEKSSLSERSDLDRVIVYNPNEKSLKSGISSISYETLSSDIDVVEDIFYIRIF